MSASHHVFFNEAIVNRPSQQLTGSAGWLCFHEMSIHEQCIDVGPTDLYRIGLEHPLSL